MIHPLKLLRQITFPGSCGDIFPREPESSGNNNALVSALNLARGQPAPMDLVAIHTHTGQVRETTGEQVVWVRAWLIHGI